MDISIFKKVFFIIIGFTLLLIGFALLFLPGPGTLIIIAGLVLLSVEFVWARRALKKLKREYVDVKEFVIKDRRYT